MAIMRTGSSSVDLDLGDDENGFLPNQIPRQLSHMLDEGQTHRLKPGPAKKTSA